METDKTILCVDDDEDTCELLSFVFQRAGFEIKSCETAEEGIRNARTNRYAAIVTDFNFGEMDGADFCRAIRTFDRETPIVFFSGEARAEKRQLALEAGAQAYIVKPADFGEVVQTVIRLISDGQERTRTAESGR